MSYRPDTRLLVAIAALAQAACTVTRGPALLDTPASLHAAAEWKFQRDPESSSALIVVGPYRLADLSESTGTMDSAIVNGGIETARSRAIRTLVRTANVESLIECRVMTWRRTVGGAFEGSSWDWLSARTQRKGSIRCASGPALALEIEFDGDHVTGEMTARPPVAIAAAEPSGPPSIPWNPAGLVFADSGGAVAVGDLRNRGGVRVAPRLEPAAALLVVATYAVLRACPSVMISQAAETCDGRYSPF